jgi:UDPglucose 6-dehydrogenase
MSVLATAPYNLITLVENAEMIKYGGNCFLYFKVIFMNILYDLTQKHNLDYSAITEAMSHDARIGNSHLQVVHKGGRGAGGHCFIKDFEAMIEMLHNNNLHDQEKAAVAIRDLNLKYLKQSNKDLDLVKEIYEKQNPHQK